MRRRCRRPCGGCGGIILAEGRDRLVGIAMSVVAEIVVVAFALFLFGLTAVSFARPAVAERFFAAFASSARTHYTEQAVRLLVGAALIVASPAMWQAALFWVIGWGVVISSVALMLAPWRWHDRLGERVRPILIPRVKLFAVGLFAFGALLLYGVFGIHE